MGVLLEDEGSVINKSDIANTSFDTSEDNQNINLLSSDDELNSCVKDWKFSSLFSFTSYCVIFQIKSSYVSNCFYFSLKSTSYSKTYSLNIINWAQTLFSVLIKNYMCVNYTKI